MGEFLLEILCCLGELGFEQLGRWVLRRFNIVDASMFGGLATIVGFVVVLTPIVLAVGIGWLINRFF